MNDRNARNEQIANVVIEPLSDQFGSQLAASCCRNVIHRQDLMHDKISNEHRPGSWKSVPPFTGIQPYNPIGDFIAGD